MSPWLKCVRRCSAFVMLVVAVAPRAGEAQEEDSHAAAGHVPGLHFSHPLFTESVSPDTKVRLDFAGVWEPDGTEREIEVEAEYAFHRSVSVEVVAPYVFLHPDVGPTSSGAGNVEIALKFGNYAFEERGLLLGYGVEVGLPTGDADAGIGTNHIWEFEPFLNVGVAVGDFELVAWGRFGIPTNQDAGEEVETDFSYDFSALYHVSDRLQVLLELNGIIGLSGEEAGEGVLAVSPGAKVAPLPGSPLFIGVGVSVPINDEELDARLKVALFWHF